MMLVMVASDNYIPSESEEYMCEKHLEYFRDKLQNWKEEIISNSKLTLENLQEKNSFPDDTDRASNETDRSIELRARDRQRKLISKIDKALKSIEDGEYKTVISTDIDQDGKYCDFGELCWKNLSWTNSENKIIRSELSPVY